MKGATASAALAAASLMLGGCQSVLGVLGLAPRPATTATAQLDMSDYFQELLDQGKTDLREGRTTQAIAAFRQASYDTSRAGEAYNGLGVAYAALGRTDLAGRYFTLALEANPLDERFARNLARLDKRDTELAVAPAAAASNVSRIATAELPGPVTPVAVGGALLPMVGVSRDEMKLATAPRISTSRPMEVMVSAKGATVAVANSPMAIAPGGPRIQSAGLRPSRGAVSVQVAANDVWRNSRPTYPVRIDLQKTK